MDSFRTDTQRAITLGAEFLERSIAACDGKGSSAFYSRVYHPRNGWEAAYPETTGYIIPTLYRTADRLGRPELATLATEQADWVVSLAHPDGALPGGFAPKDGLGDPSVFNTGQMIIGLCAASDRTGDERFLDAASRAATWLADAVDPTTGRWTDHAYVEGHSPAYYTRVAWPMLEVWSRTGDEAIRSAAEQVLDAIVADRLDNGVFHGWAFKPGQAAFTHTIAYTIRGLIESARLLGDDGARFADPAHDTARRLMRKTELQGGLAGAYHDDWKRASWYTCLTGNCQMAIIWLGMAEELDDRRYVSTALKALQPVLNAQATGRLAGAARGSIAGSSPIWGRYLFMRRPNWATKFMIDALLDAESALASIEHDLAQQGALA